MAGAGAGAKIMDKGGAGAEKKNNFGSATRVLTTGTGNFLSLVGRQAFFLINVQIQIVMGGNLTIDITGTAHIS